MINLSDVKGGTKLIFDGAPWNTVSVDFVKPGKGQAFYKLRVLNLLTGNTLEKTLRSGEKVESAEVFDADMEYLYREGENFIFMDLTTYDQLSISPTAVGAEHDLLVENQQCVVTTWNGEAISIRLPKNMEFEIVYTEPAVKGDTQSRVMKEAKMNTGALIQVPTFCDIGDKVTINTETREYISRK